MLFFIILDTTQDVDITEQTQANKEKEKESTQDKAITSAPPSEHDEFDDQNDNVIGFVTICSILFFFFVNFIDLFNIIIVRK